VKSPFEFVNYINKQIGNEEHIGIDSTDNSSQAIDSKLHIPCKK